MSQDEYIQSTISSNKSKIHHLEDDLKRMQHSIGEREKELTCHLLLSHLLDELTGSPTTFTQCLSDIVKIIPQAWQYPDITAVRLTCSGATFVTNNFSETSWRHEVPVFVNYPERHSVGALQVYYLEERPEMFSNTPFLKEEFTLLQIVAERIGNFISHKLVENKVKRLTSVTIPICPKCNSIRCDGEWVSLVDYLESEEGKTVETSLCINCTSKRVSQQPEPMNC